MRKLIRAAAVDPLVRSTGIAIAGDCPPLGLSCRAQRVRAWVARKMQFVPDPRETETIGAPAWHLATIRAQRVTWGDCDDAATLVGALCRTLGLAVRLVAASFTRDGDPSHVWAEAWDGSGWVELDTMRAQRMNHTPTRSLILEV